MKLHIKVGDYEFIELDSLEELVTVVAELRQLQTAYSILHDFPEREKSLQVKVENHKKWKRPPEEHKTDLDKMSAVDYSEEDLIK